MGDSHLEAFPFPLDPEAEIGVDLLHVPGRDLDAEDALHLAGLDGEGHFLLGAGAGVGDALRHRAADVATDKVGGLSCRRRRPGGRHPSSETEGGLAVQAVVGGGAADAGAVEAGRLDQDVRRPVVNLRLFSAHDTGQRHRTAAVTDQQVLGGAGALRSVEGDDLLPLPGGAQVDRSFLPLFRPPKQVVIEGVERLARLPHDVVRDVDDVVYRPDPGKTKTVPHPEGRGPDRNTGHHGGGVARTAVGVSDLDGDQVVHGVPFLDEFTGAFPEAAGPEGVHLPGHAGQGETVGEVGGEIHGHHRVAEVLPQGRPDGRVIGEDHDPSVLLREAEFPLRADHPLGSDAADFGGFKRDRPVASLAVAKLRADEGDGHLDAGHADGDVRRPRHHLQRIVAEIHGDEGQLVGIGVTPDTGDFADEDPFAIPVTTDLGDIFDFEAGEGQPLGEFGHGNLDGDEVLEPFQRHFHELPFQAAVGLL